MPLPVNTSRLGIPRTPSPSPLPSLLRVFLVEHPLDAEAVGALAEAGAPEGVLEGHRDLAAVGEFVEEVGLLVGVREVEAQRNVRAYGARLDGVGCHEGEVALLEVGVHHEVLGFVGDREFGVRGHFREAHDTAFVGAEDVLIEVHGLFAVAEEVQVGCCLFHGTTLQNGGGGSSEVGDIGS
jgi:hypothetical protein